MYCGGKFGNVLKSCTVVQLHSSTVAQLYSCTVLQLHSSTLARLYSCTVVPKISALIYRVEEIERFYLTVPRSESLSNYYVAVLQI